MFTLSSLLAICLAVGARTAQGATGNPPGCGEPGIKFDPSTGNRCPNPTKDEAGGKRSVQIRSEDGDVVIEAGKEGAALVFKVGDERLSIDEIPANMRAYSDATQSILNTGFMLGEKHSSISDTCADFLKKLNDGVDRDIAELKSGVGDVKDDVDDKLIAAKDATAATLKTAAEDQAKLNAALKEELLAAVKSAKEDAAAAKSAANGFKACDYSKQFYNKATDKCQNVKTCSSGQTYTEKPMFSDWTCGVAAASCVPMKDLCRKYNGKTGLVPVCETGKKVFCEMDTEGGKWSLMMNIHPSDHHSVGYKNDAFWAHAQEYGDINRALDSDFKSAFAATYVGTEILGVSAEFKNHKVKGYRMWGFKKTWNSMFKPGINGIGGNYHRDSLVVHRAGCQTDAPKKTVKGTTSSWDDVIRQGGCLRSDLNPTRSGWGDVIRLTTIDGGTRDNDMSGFASCIDCGRPWQGSDESAYLGRDHALCNKNRCHYNEIKNMKGPEGQQDPWRDCIGNYCWYGNRGWENGWTSQFFIR